MLFFYSFQTLKHISAFTIENAQPATLGMNFLIFVVPPSMHFRNTLCRGKLICHFPYSWYEFHSSKIQTPGAFDDTVTSVNAKHICS